MRAAAVLLVAVAVAGCGGGRRAAEPPAPTTLPSPQAAPATTIGPLHYRVRGSQAYEISRNDSLFYGPGSGATAQTSDKVGLLMVRSISGRENGELEITLQSLAAGPGTRLEIPALDSAMTARWRLMVDRSGAVEAPTIASRSVLASQMWVVGRLLFPQLPTGGLGQSSRWEDSTSYPARVDAFDATESSVRTSAAVAATNGVRVEATERLKRSGGVTQGGQAMSLSGGGVRWLSYEFGEQGMVTRLSARDSLELRVRVEATGQVIPVRWRSSFTAQLRGAPPR